MKMPDLTIMIGKCALPVAGSPATVRKLFRHGDAKRRIEAVS
jgi:hypothetical protein